MHNLTETIQHVIVDSFFLTKKHQFIIEVTHCKNMKSKGKFGIVWIPLQVDSACGIKENVNNDIRDIFRWGKKFLVEANSQIHIHRWMNIYRANI